MVMRSDPFHDLEQLTHQVFGRPAHPAVVPIDA